MSPRFPQYAHCGFNWLLQIVTDVNLVIYTAYSSLAATQQCQQWFELIKTTTNLGFHS